MPRVSLFRASVLPYIYKRIGRGIWQIIISFLIGAAGFILSFVEKRQDGAALLTFGSYFAFLIGIAAVTILVNSITIGLLVYYFQSTQAGRNYYYDNFRDATTVLRNYLDSLRDDEIISSEYTKGYRDIELLTMERLPVGWEEIYIPFLEKIFDELRQNLGPGDEYDRIAGSVEVKAIVLNEAVSGLWVNLVQRVGMKLWVSPVLKSFWTLALTILVLIIGAVNFAGIEAHILAGIAIAIGCMTILLILELGFRAVAESREFFDDKTDIDHSQTETHRLAS